MCAPTSSFSDCQAVHVRRRGFLRLRRCDDERARIVLVIPLQPSARSSRLSRPIRVLVVITVAAPFAAGAGLLDNLPILPRPNSSPALKAGTFAKAWNRCPRRRPRIVVPRAVLLAEYLLAAPDLHAQSALLSQAPDGAQLPYSNRLTIEIHPLPTPEMLRLEAGQIDHGGRARIPPEGYAPLNARPTGARSFSIFESR